MTRKRLLRSLAVAAVCLSSVLTPAGSSSASDAFGPPPIAWADSPDHWFCFFLMPPEWTNTFYIQMEVLDIQTDMWDEPAGTCGSSTDVVFAPQNLPDFPAPVLGQYACLDYVDPLHLVCERAAVYKDYDAISYVVALRLGSPGSSGDFFTDLAQNILHTICHEIGHTTGLHHDTIGGIFYYPHCMTSGWVGIDPRFREYHVHHVVDNINPAY